MHNILQGGNTYNTTYLTIKRRGQTTINGMSIYNPYNYAKAWNAHYTSYHLSLSNREVRGELTT